MKGEISRHLERTCHIGGKRDSLSILKTVKAKQTQQGESQEDSFLSGLSFYPLWGGEDMQPSALESLNLIIPWFPHSS